MSDRYVIAWESRLTGFRSCGDQPFSGDDAREICDRLNREFPDLRHYPSIYWG